MLTPSTPPVAVVSRLVVPEVVLRAVLKVVHLAAVDPAARPISPRMPDAAVASRPKEVASPVLGPSHPRDVDRVKLCESLYRLEMLRWSALDC